MTRLTNYLLPTLKDAPSDAEALSHQLMVRAGLVRQLGSGIWSWLPAGYRSVKKVEAIIREEMDAIGCHEMLMPVIQPADLWRTTGRYDIAELFKLKDRKDADLVLAITHEEAVTSHVAREIRSYRELPLMLYHLQTKERDEPRPRAGILRTREFTMKDAYSFDRDEEGLARSYELQSAAYERIYDRCGLDWYRVDSDVGMMGGTAAHEYMAPCAAGEDEIVLAPGYAANLEVASAVPQPVELPPPLDAPREAPTPGLTTVEEVSGALGVPSGALVKAMAMVVEGRGLVVVLVRGDHRLNETKLANHCHAPIRQAKKEEIEESIGPVGFIGPVGVDVPVLMDRSIEGGGLVTGANKLDAHLIGVEPGRDFHFESCDVRFVEAGDKTEAGDPVEIVTAIEIGNIFKLGTRYSVPLGATYLDESSTEHPIVMGSYGIGPARIVASAVEQGADDKGISWPVAIAPWQVHIVQLGKGGDEAAKAADAAYEALSGAGIEAVLDDRPNARTGEKLTDAELIGCPLRLLIGKRGVADGVAESQERVSGEEDRIPLGELAPRVGAILDRIGSSG